MKHRSDKKYVVDLVEKVFASKQSEHAIGTKLLSFFTLYFSFNIRSAISKTDVKIRANPTAIIILLSIFLLSLRMFLPSISNIY